MTNGKPHDTLRHQARRGLEAGQSLKPAARKLGEMARAHGGKLMAGLVAVILIWVIASVIGH